MIKVEKELLTAKKASLKSAELLIKQKNIVNDVISNEDGVNLFSSLLN